MKIAIVEDDREFARLLERSVLSEPEWKAAKVDIYGESGSFQKAIAGGQQYDFCFLDIGLPDVDGLQLAEWLRESGIELPIVFVTSFLEYAIKGYRVQAFDYLLKSQLDREWKGMAERLKRRLAETDGRYYELVLPNRVERMPVGRMYCN